MAAGRWPLMSLLCIILTSVMSHAQPQYTFTDLGPFQPNGIAGPWVVGQENGQPTRLNLDTMQKITLGHQGLGGIAWAVIASGEAVGDITIQSVAGPVSSAAWWDIDGQVHLLDGPLPSAARGFADTGTVVGASLGCPGGGKPMRWRNGGTDACLATPTLGGNRTTGGGVAVDRADRVWGTINQAELQFAWVWLVDGTSQGAPLPEGYLGSRTHAVSPDGMGVGESGHDCAQCPSRAWIGTLDGGGSWLPNPAGQPRPWTWCSANAINAQHQSVGVCSSPNPPFPHAVVLWPDTTTAVDLTVLTGLPLGSATGINDDGEIVGRLSNGGHGYLLTPVPANVASAPCGGSVVCQCGDTVTRDYVFTANLRCDLHGAEAALIIGDHVSVSGNNFYLIGTGDGIGVLFDRTQGSRIGALHVAGFDTGVLMRGSHGSVFHSAWVWDHRHDGVRLEAGAQDNWIWGVYSLLNGLRSGNHGSGIHLQDAAGNIVIYSIAWANPTAFDLERSNGNWSWQNAWYGGQHPMTMVDSHYNGLYQSVFIEGTITLQQSDDNSWFDGNDIRVPLLHDQAVASR